jgi:hypothetical protein
MAAPVVSGTVALMLQANPNLTPNLIKAILQYTAEAHPYRYSPLREGAGFLNTLGAVDLARFYATKGPGSKLPVKSNWSRTIIWGNHRLTKGNLLPTANAWGLNIVWGTAKTMGDYGDNIVWGTASFDGDNIVWGTASLLGNILWGTASLADNIVWGTFGDGDNIVWGTAFDTLDNIVWGTDCGGADCDNIVWGTAADLLDNIVWGTADMGDNIVWGTAGFDNIVWSTSADDDPTWGSSGEDEVAFPDESLEILPSTVFDFSAPVVAPVLSLTSSLLGGL